MKKLIFKPSRKMALVKKYAHRAKFRILEGAVRSGKSFVSNDIALSEIEQLPTCDILVSGYSISSVARNVISEWKKMLDPNDHGYFRNVRDEKDDFLVIENPAYPKFFGKKFYIRGAGKEHDFKQIQGATLGYWLADELTRHAKSFVDMTITRLSPAFAKAIWTTNPDSPHHYVKKDFLDKKELFKVAEDGTALFKRWTFFLDDNPSLTDEYKESLRRVHTGVFYKRNVLSMWVMAEGAIYDNFDEARHVRVPDLLPKSSRYVLSVDYGTGNPTVFLLFKYNPASWKSGEPKIWLVREYYYDSKAEGRQKTDAEYSADMKRFLSGVEVDKIIIDPSAASFKVQLSQDGFFGITDAANDVVNGIRTQARMLENGEYLISSKCPRTIEDYGAYVWDEKAQLLGLDKPVKMHDHTKDAERYALYTLYGDVVYNLEQMNTM